jgi:hypothetical protein
LQKIDKKVGCPNGATACRAGDLELCIQGENDSGPVGCGIGMRQAAANRAEIPHLHIADMVRSLREERTAFCKQRGRENLGVCRHGPDREATPVRLAAPARGRTFLDGTKLANGSQIDERCRLRKTELHCRKQAMSTGKRTRIFAKPRQQLHRVVYRFGTVVIERCWNHDGLLRDQTFPTSSAPSPTSSLV